MRENLKKSHSLSSTQSNNAAFKMNGSANANGNNSATTSWAVQKASFAAVAQHHHGGSSTAAGGTTTAAAPDRAPSPPPQPTTWVGVAALQLAPPEAQQQQSQISSTHQHHSPVVYLLTVQYLRKWLQWAYQLDASARDQLRKSAVALGLAPPTDNNDNDKEDDDDDDTPGPIDSTVLSVEGHPLVLSPLVKLHTPWWDDNDDYHPGDGLGVHSTNAVPFGRSRTTASATRTSSSGALQVEHDNNTTSTTTTDTAAATAAAASPATPSTLPPLAVAVPEPFYEMIRNTHGVMCDDGHSVSFQPPAVDHHRSPYLLHHQVFGSGSGGGGKGIGIGKNNSHDDVGSQYYQNQHNLHQQQPHGMPRPVEFRRRRIYVPQRRWDSNQPPTSLMDKLLLEEPSFVVSRVEVHPLKVLYTIVDNEDFNDEFHGPGNKDGTVVPSPHGYGLVSRQAPAVAGLRALVRAAVPHKAAQQLRLWVTQGPYPISPTPANPWKYHALGPSLDGLTSDDMPGLLEDHVVANDAVGNILIEVRPSVNADWPLRRRELVHRLRVGDSCDAPDVAGKWYEAIVVGIENHKNTDEQSSNHANGDTAINGDRSHPHPSNDWNTPPTVRVHYLGWARKWDTALSPTGPGPKPLWSRTLRWREQVVVGQVVEVRDSSSRADRPKWYKGVVRRVGHPHDPPRPIVGGADLELQDDGKPLLLLGQTRQVLVEVEQEKNSVTPALLKQAELAAAAASPIGADPDPKGLEPQPPYRRWVNLYGEEICQLGTHLKKEEASGAPATLRYELDAGRKPVEVLKGRGAGFIRESLRGTPPAPGSVGLQNLGNSCYMNGIVQCLNHIELLTQYFLQDKYSKELNRSNPLGSGGNVTLAYASLLKKMWSGEYCILAPRSLKQTVAGFAPQFDNSYQHDSQEFCQFLMDGLHEDLNRVKTKPYVEELEGFGMEDEVAAIESWRKHLLRHDSIVVDHCQGMHRSHLTCPRCGRESIKFDVYSSISLPLVTTKNRSARIKLEDCLEKFMEGEQLDERNAWYCPSCRQHVCALKMIALWSVPDILILHLKRFTFDTCMTSGGMLRSKMDNTVEFPIERLDLTRHILGPVDPLAPPVYKLCGVSEHTGPTANSGHYTATIRNSIDGKWYRCNDSHVGHTSGEASITSDAYLLFYQRARGVTRWGGMEKVMLDRSINPYGGLQTDKDGFAKVNKKKKKKGTSEDSSRTTQ